jgi:hypothetical protein
LVCCFAIVNGSFSTLEEVIWLRIFKYSVNILKLQIRDYNQV